MQKWIYGNTSRNGNFEMKKGWFLAILSGSRDMSFWVAIDLYEG